MAKEKEKTETAEAIAPVATPALPPGASLAADGILELDPRRTFTDGELKGTRLGCYFEKKTGRCLQGPGVRTGHHYVDILRDLSKEAFDAAVQERLALGYVRVEGVYHEGYPGSLVFRMPEIDFQRHRDAKDARAKRQNAQVAAQGEREIRQIEAAAERNAPKEG